MPEPEVEDQMPKRIAIITVGRSDFSILRPLARLLAADPGFDVGFWVGGAHFDVTGGTTGNEIQASGLPVWAEIRVPDGPRDAAGTAKAMAAQIAGFATAAAAAPLPDLVLILGDRYEAIAAGLALVPFNIPIAHISGGSVTEGAMDDTFRHCLTKIATLHFCDIPEFARRIHRMGEDPSRIFAVGALGLDGIRDVPARGFDDMARHFGFGPDLGEGYAIATLHPETRAPEQTSVMAKAMIAALVESGLQVIYTYPNADPGCDAIVAAIEAAARTHAGHHVVRSFGADWFNSAMAHAHLMIGNSSGGIIEAASFGLPVIDIGDRQKGRFHGANVVHCGRTTNEIAAAIQLAIKMRMAETWPMLTNPYGDGHASERVVSVLRALDWDRLAGAKRFCNHDPDYSGDYVEMS